MRINKLIAVMLLALWVTPAAAEETQTQKAPRLRRVAVLPVLNFIRSPESLWESKAGSPGKTPEQIIQDYLIRRLAVEPKLQVFAPKQVMERIMALPSHAGKIDLGINRMDLGMDLFKNLRVTDAIPHLEQAHAALKDAHYSLLAPYKMATLLLTLAQCQLEEKLGHLAHIKLKEMFFRSPRKRFKQGFYSNTFEQALKSALVDFVATYPKGNPLGSMAGLDRFVNDIDVDSLVYAYLVSGNDGPQIMVRVYDRESRNFSYRSTLPSAGHANDLERIDRFVSRWATCLPTHVGLPKGPQSFPSRFFIDTNFSYSLFLKDPTRRVFHNLGMGLSAEWQFAQSLGVFGQINMYTSIQDPDRDLKDSVSSVRVVAGLSFAIDQDWWRIFLRLGFDVHVPGSFTITTDAHCKFFGEGDKECTGDVFHLGGEITMGPTGALGAQFFVGRDLYVSVRINASTYVIPLDRSAVLNHPFGMETGIGYTF